jgi:DNA repair exonuclease SbcCD ATPase subunit
MDAIEPREVLQHVRLRLEAVDEALPMLFDGLQLHVTRAREAAANAVISEKVLLANELEQTKAAFRERKQQADQTIASVMAKFQEAQRSCDKLEAQVLSLRNELQKLHQVKQLYQDNVAELARVTASSLEQQQTIQVLQRRVEEAERPKESSLKELEAQVSRLTAQILTEQERQRALAEQLQHQHALGWTRRFRPCVCRWPRSCDCRASSTSASACSCCTKGRKR